MAATLGSFRSFLDELREVWGEDTTVEEKMQRARPLLEALVVEPSLQEHARTWPCTEGLGNLLLYEDPDYGFVVNAVVRSPERVGGIHDHAQAWVLYGLVDGTESLERYDRLDDGSDPTYAEVQLASVSESGPGTVDLVPPFGIHREKGGGGRSVAVILRSERLVGRMLQGRYNPETKVRTEGSHAEIPFELTVLEPAI